MATDPIGEHRPPQLTLRSLFVVTTVVAIALGILVPSVRKARESARRSRCGDNLKQIALGLHNYNDTWNRFPPSYTVDHDRRLHSWRTFVLPYQCSSSLYQLARLGEPWDSSNNRQFRSTERWMYRCPATEARPAKTLTNYLAVAGAGTAWPGTACKTLADFERGLSNTVLAAEAAGSDVRWAEPRDLEFDRLDFRINGPDKSGISSAHGDGANIVFADGSLRWFTADTAPEDLKPMFLLREDVTDARLVPHTGSE